MEVDLSEDFLQLLVFSFGDIKPFVAHTLMVYRQNWRCASNCFSKEIIQLVLDAIVECHIFGILKAVIEGVSWYMVGPGDLGLEILMDKGVKSHFNWVSHHLKSIWIEQRRVDFVHEKDFHINRGIFGIPNCSHVKPPFQSSQAYF